MATRGDVTEAAILTAFVRLDVAVLLPWRADLPYDLVVTADHQTFLRVQCKSGRERGGCVLFNSAGTDHGRGRQHYRGRADLLAVWCPTLDEVYVVPVDEAAGFVTSLRVRPSRNNQTRGIRHAADYTVERWAERFVRDVAA